MLKKYIILSAFILIAPMAYANHDIVGDRCAALNDGTSPCHYGNSANGYECKKICNWRAASRPTSGGGFSGFFSVIATAAATAAGNLFSTPAARPATAPATPPTVVRPPTRIIPPTSPSDYFRPTSVGPVMPCEKNNNENSGSKNPNAICFLSGDPIKDQACLDELGPN